MPKLWKCLACTAAAIALFLASCQNPSSSDGPRTASGGIDAGISAFVELPAEHDLGITGASLLHYGSASSFGCRYTGTAAGYQWSLGGSPIAGATASSLSLTPAIGPTWPYGANLLSLSVTDASGIVYSASLLLSVGN